MVSSSPSFSSIVWSAVRAGSCGFVSWRVSSHAHTGRVAVASFSSPVVAAAFARRWAQLLGRTVVVRQGPLVGGRVRSWRVSVPVQLWPSQSQGQLLVSGAGAGVAGVATALRALGFPPAA